MYLGIVGLPLMGAIMAGLFSKVVGAEGSKKITTICVSVAWILGLIGLYEVMVLGQEHVIYMGDWINIGGTSLRVEWGWKIDWLSSIMVGVVTSISMLVHYYSMDYIEGDAGESRFMSYLSLFTFFMLILVTAKNLIMMFIGWEGVGLCSYLLINYWHTSIQANKSGLKAVFVNRVGDIAVIIGLVLIYKKIGIFDYDDIFYIIYKGGKEIDVKVLTIIGLLLFGGVAAKSAQIGLHVWLPDAMAAPSPVSALLHAATMVTAGIYLMARMSLLLEMSEDALKIIAIVGGITAVYGGSIAIVQNDIKKVIAYSTCSQLGYMTMVCGLSGYNVAIYHLTNHAFFKALLFLGAGAIIHNMGDEQDVRRYGGLIRVMPVVYGTMLIGGLALMGFPYLAGYYSKDIILEIAYGKYTAVGFYCYILGVLAAICTSFYTIRLLTLTFGGWYNGYKSTIEKVHDVKIERTGIVLIALALGSIFIGWGGESIFIEHDVNLVVPRLYSKGPIILILISGISAFIIYNRRGIETQRWGIVGKKVIKFLSKKWYVDRIIHENITMWVLKAGYEYTYKIIDRGILERIGPYGSIKVAQRIRPERVQSGSILGMVRGIIIVLNIMIIIMVIILYKYYYQIF